MGRMDRRAFLQAVGTTPLLATPVSGATPAPEDVSRNFFRSLPDSESERSRAIANCATDFCRTTRVISEQAISAVVESGDDADELLRRVRFGIRILNEHNLTDVVDESMISTAHEALGKGTKYLPLLGSFNNLRSAACAVETPDPDPENVKEFLYATAAFGLEVVLWSIGAPYKMAWRGTRFISNRTFLRFARHGCNNCIAFVMSELHWALRGSVYSEAVTQNKVEFVVENLQELRKDAEDWDYDVELNHSREEVERLLNPGGGGGPMAAREPDGFIERLLSDISIQDLSLPFIAICLLFVFRLRD